MSQTTKEAKDVKDAKGAPKARVFALASELNLDTKTILEFCKELGFAGIKNQLNTLEPDQVTAIKERVKKGPKAAAKPATPVAAAPVKPIIPPKVDDKIRTLTKSKAAPKSPQAAPPAAQPAAVEPSHPAPAATPPTPAEPPTTPAAVVEPPAPIAAAEPVSVTPAVGPSPVAAEAQPPVAPPEPAPVLAAEATPATLPVAEAPTAASVPPAAPPGAPATPPTAVVPPAIPPTNRVPNLNQTRPPTVIPGGGRPPQVLPPRPAPIPPRPPAGGSNPQARSGPPHSAPAGSTRPGGPNPPPPGSARPGQPHPASPASRSGGPNPPPPGSGRPGGPPGASRPGSGPGSARPGGPNPPPPRTGMTPPRPGGPNPPPPRTGPGGPAPSPQPGAKSVKLTLDQIQRLRDLERSRGGQKISLQDVHKHVVAPTDPVKPGAPAGPGASGRHGRTGLSAKDDDGEGRGHSKKGIGEVSGRDARHRARADKGRQRGPLTDRASLIIGPGGRVDTIERDYGSRRKLRRGQAHVVKRAAVITGPVEIATPITVRSLSEAIGMKGGELLLKLKQLTDSLFTINSNVDLEVAKLIADERGIELVPKKQESAEDKTLRELQEKQQARSGEEHLVPRPPIVTIMGHVDHGKTSLLDKIRQQYGLASDVVSTETGGITQVIRAWRVEKDGKSITFLDTPGHEAFTKMRARGANVTDIAVIVVSAADGIMPQTQEAVSHAKAAGVDIIVAINKIDLPGANPEKVKSQLYNLELVPEDMGGDVPVVYTSAVTGQGIGELLDAIALLAELADLKADPDLSASGTCLEAYLDPEEGVRATLLVQQGTLHRGDVMLCGATFGKVRSMTDDLGRPIESAGPSTPVRITGLNEVPDADDQFYAVPEVATAREIASKRKDRKQEAQLHRHTPISMDLLKERNTKPKISELKVILKAEARGSVEAIKKEMEKLVHDEVRVRVLHAGIGAITESDVQLALTSPEDTLLVGFNVTADDQALRLADERGISDKIREYDIIYKLTDDIKAALEGRLKPIEEVVHLGRAIVRQTFKVGKVGTIAGCYVTSGTIERNARVRVIREGVVIYPPSDKQVGLDSLKRFKDDAKEVREGFECGLKITGFDDVKVGDVIEAFKIEIKQRTL